MQYIRDGRFGDIKFFPHLTLRREKGFQSSVNSDWDLYFFDEKTEEITMAEGLGSGPDPMGAYYYCGGLHNINEAYTYLDYQFEEPDFPVPVQRSDDIFESSDGYYGYWLQGMYAVYSDGALTTDFIYEECGSESNGVLAAKKDGKWGVINNKGEIVQEPTYNLDDYLVIDFVGKWHLGKDLNMNYYNQE